MEIGKKYVFLIKRTTHHFAFDGFGARLLCPDINNLEPSTI